MLSLRSRGIGSAHVLSKITEGLALHGSKKSLTWDIFEIQLAVFKLINDIITTKNKYVISNMFLLSCP